MITTYGYGFDLECPYCYRQMVVESFSDGTHKVSHAALVCPESRAYAFDLGEHEIDRFLSNGESERERRRWGRFAQPLFFLCFAVHPPAPRVIEVNYPVYLRKGQRAVFGMLKSNVVAAGLAHVTDFAIDGKVYLPGSTDLAHVHASYDSGVETEALSRLTREAVSRGLGVDQSERIARFSFRLSFAGGHAEEVSLLGRKGICLSSEGENR